MERLVPALRRESADDSSTAAKNLDRAVQLQDAVPVENVSPLSGYLQVLTGCTEN